MLEKYHKVFEVVCALAKKRHEALNASAKNRESAGAYDTANHELTDFLSCLDIETLKILQAVMYIGRDRSTFGEQKPDRILADYRRRYCASWLPKESELQPLTESFQLDTYLKAGLEVLGI